jgi:hypothetical protein
LIKLEEHDLEKIKASRTQMGRRRWLAISPASGRHAPSCLTRGW